MSLLVWLPLNGNIINRGLSNLEVTNSGATVNNTGKIGPCYYFNGSTYMYENTYDWWWGGYFWEDLPKDIKFSRNQTSAWGEKGASPFLNSDKYTTVVMRKFE